MPKKKDNLSPEERLIKAVIPKEEEPYKLPDNWVWTKVKEVNEVVTGNTPSKKVQEYWENRNINFVKPSDLSQKRNLKFSEEYIDNRAKEKVRLIPKYSTILCCIGSIGKSSFSEIECCTNQQINSLVPKSSLNALYNYYYSTSLFFINQMKNSSSATTIAILNKSKTEELLFPLAPLSEQKRIVEKLDSLFEKTGKIKEIIKEVKEKTSSRREAVLSKAFTGELTEKWRAENKTENAKELLLKINEEKLKNNPKAKIKDISEMLVNENEVPYKVPENWVWTRLGDITEINPKKKILDFNEDEEVSFVPMKSVSEETGRIEKIEYEKYSKLKKGYTQFIEEDVLFAKITPCMENGKCAIAENLKNNIGYGTTEFHVLRCYQGVINSLLHKFLRQENFRKEAEYNMTGSVGFRRVPVDFLKSTLFPLPPLDEQKEIVRILDKVFEEEDKISELISLEEKVEILEKTILDKAFRGELGTGNSDDEPAIELLKRALEENK